MSDDGYSLGHPVARRPAVVAAAVCGLVATGQAQVNVLTYHNDNARTGQNLIEIVLKPSNVNQASHQRLTVSQLL